MWIHVFFDVLLSYVTDAVIYTKRAVAARRNRK